MRFKNIFLFKSWLRYYVFSCFCVRLVYAEILSALTQCTQKPFPRRISLLEIISDLTLQEKLGENTDSVNQSDAKSCLKNAHQNHFDYVSLFLVSMSKKQEGSVS
jgi:hypothetical protein